MLANNNDRVILEGFGRFYIHGDLAEPGDGADGLYFCARCDTFELEAHFYNDPHAKIFQDYTPRGKPRGKPRVYGTNWQRAADGMYYFKMRPAGHLICWKGGYIKAYRPEDAVNLFLDVA